MLTVGCCSLFVVYCLLRVGGVLFVGCWLLVVGCWLLVVGCWLFGHSLFDVCGWLLVVSCCLLFLVSWFLLVAFCSFAVVSSLLLLIVACCFLFVVYWLYHVVV